MYSKRRVILTLAFLTLCAVSFRIYWSNTALELNKYTIVSEKIPKSFDGFRIAHVSDLHNAEIGDNNVLLLNMLRQSEPDIIAITGDLIDSRNTNIDVALQFAEQASQIAPCYYVTGNHEARTGEYRELQKGLMALGITVLEDQRMKLEKSGESITLLGINDPSFQTNDLFGDAQSITHYKLQMLVQIEAGYTILLSHRPELFDIYQKNDIDLILSGHAHGGQFRIPFVGGLIAPNQGFFPKYDAGLYTEQDTNMIVSRGIGNSIIPFRINNRPEAILIELSKPNI